MTYSNLNNKPVSKREYFESHNYTNGVKDKNGKLLIRKLTVEEKEFIYKFESEFIAADFDYDPRIKRLLKRRKALLKQLRQSDAIVGKELELLKEMLDNSTNTKSTESLIRRISFFKKDKYVNSCREFLAEALNPEVEDLNSQISQLRLEVNLHKTPEQRKSIFKENNSRVMDLLNRAKSTGDLINFDIFEVDRFTEDHIKSIPDEGILVNDDDSTEH